MRREATEAQSLQAWRILEALEGKIFGRFSLESIEYLLKWDAKK